MLICTRWPLLCLIFISTIDGKKYRRFGDEGSSDQSTEDQRVLIDVDIYNRPYTLPYFLRQLEDLQCPVGQCYLDLRLYHVYHTAVENETTQIVTEWVAAMKRSSTSAFAAITIHEWSAKSTDDRVNRLDDVLKRCIDLDVTYLAMFDSMVVLLESEKLLSTLIAKDKPMMAPLLRSTKDVFTSTFYLDDQKDTSFHQYRQIYERKKVGCFLLDGGIKDFYFVNFQFEQVRDALLKQTNRSSFVSGIDLVAKRHGIPMYICNREIFGYIPAQYVEALYDEPIIRELYMHMLVEHQLNGPGQTYLPPIRRTSLVSFPPSTKTKFGFDEIYVINLLRRADRRERLQATFDILNISVRFFDAVDGKDTVDQKYLENLNVRLLPNYEDPYNRRPMNYGELGCFFSHYFIWKDMVEKNYENGVLILEDDVRFDVYFKYKLERVFANRSFDWDLVYLGRKIMRPDDENYDQTNQTYLIQPAYSHWTVGYALSLRGAKMLLDENPLGKLLPVDEYLPVMIDHHPNASWKSHFHHRKLKAYAFHPAILTPTHYYGEPNYISDTENTTIFSQSETPKTDGQTVSVDVVTPASVSEAKDEL